MTEERSAIVRELSAPLAAGKGWMKLLGVVFIIQGALAAITIIGIIVAWLPIWIGVLLMQSAGAIEQAQATGDEVQFRRSMDKLRTYFLILGILLLISIALMVLAIFSGAMLGTLMHSTGNF